MKTLVCQRRRSEAEARKRTDRGNGEQKLRLGKNPNRSKSPEQRRAAVARLRANIERTKRNGDPGSGG